MWVAFNITNDEEFSHYPDLWVRLDGFTLDSGTLIPGLAPGEDGNLHIGSLPFGDTAMAFFYVSWPHGTEPAADTFTADVSIYDSRPSYPGAQLLTDTTFSWTAVSTIASNANQVLDIDGDGIAVSFSTADPVIGGLMTVTVEGTTGTLGDDNKMIFTPSSLPAFPADGFELRETVISFYEVGSLLGTPVPAAGVPSPVVNHLVTTSLSSDPMDYVAEYTFRPTEVTPALACTEDADCQVAGPELICNISGNVCGVQISPILSARSGLSLKHTFPDSIDALPPIPPVQNSASLDKVADVSVIEEIPGADFHVEYSLTLSNASTLTLFVDEFVDTPPPGATVVPGSSFFGMIAIDDPIQAGGENVWSSLFPIPPGDGAGTDGEAILSFQAELSALQRAMVTVDTAVAFTDYVINIVTANTGGIGADITYSSSGGDSEVDIAEGLRDQINGEPLVNTVLSATSSGAVVHLVADALSPGFLASETDTNLTLVRGRHDNSAVTTLGVSTIDESLSTDDSSPALASVLVHLCGDYEVTGEEACDDGNEISGDGCSALCALEVCGDGITQPGLGEQCDTMVQTAECEANCTIPSCGDGITNPLVDPPEECDDGIDNSDVLPDACRTNCVAAYCGDDVTDSTEECDDGILNSDVEPDACRSSCLAAYCGDGVLDSGEQCDDAGILGDDGCSASCEVESDWNCSGQPSICLPETVLIEGFESQ